MDKSLLLKTIKKMKASKSDKEAMKKQVEDDIPYTCFALLGVAKRLGLK